MQRWETNERLEEDRVRGNGPSCALSSNVVIVGVLTDSFN